MFAREGVVITATDRPADEHGWAGVGQYGGGKEALFYPEILDRPVFDERVSFEFCDMKRIPKELAGYDFCWSCCAFEHLGTLREGLDFIVESIERTVKIGGIACHTTELNLSSDETTIETERYVIYRRRDLLELCDTLERRGHTVDPLRIETGGQLPDFLVDVPPYRGNPHLKLRIGDLISTSVGLVIRRGK